MNKVEQLTDLLHAISASQLAQIDIVRAFHFSYTSLDNRESFKIGISKLI
ncbi:MAG: hypothetical protein V2I33_26270 [Kangiellaceae bacterium]|nr:hypothetical protein [Kangiellaceae bacterium]